AKLIIYAAGFMAFGAEYVQSAGLNHFFMLGVGDFARARNGVFPLLLVGLVGIDLFFFQILFGQELGVSAKQYICSASGHVCCYSDLAFASRLGDDIGFARGVFRFGVQNIMGHASLFEAGR